MNMQRVGAAVLHAQALGIPRLLQCRFDKLPREQVGGAPPNTTSNNAMQLFTAREQPSGQAGSQGSTRYAPQLSM